MSERDSYSSAGQALGIASLVLAIISLLVSFIPCIGSIALVPAGIAILLGAIGLVQASKHNAPRGLLISGLIVGIVAFFIAGAWSFLINGTNNAFEDFEEEVIEELNNVIIDEEVQEDILDQVSEFEKVIDSIDVKEVNISINNEELSDEEKEELKESVKEAGKKVGDALKGLAKDLEDIEEKRPE